MGTKETKVSDSIKRSHRFKDLTGQRFNKLKVIELSFIKNKRAYWKCQCDCGNIRIVNAGHLKNGHTKSCGCLKGCKEGNENPSYRHGLRHSKLYQTWVNMKTRCYNSNNKTYKNYGGRGIKICEEWLNKENGFINFYNWAIENGYKEGLTIDRIDVNGDYKPNNCRWANWKKQQNNRGNNFKITYNNKTHTLQEWSEILPIEISSSTLRNRITKKWDIEKAFTTPVDRRKSRWENEKRNNITK